MKDITVFGVAYSPEGLGDALQYFVMVKILNDLSPESNLTLACQNLRKALFVFQNLDIKTKFLDLNPFGYGAFWRLLRSPSLDCHQAKDGKLASVEGNNPRELRFSSSLRKLYEKYLTFYDVDKFVSLSFLRSYHSDASIIGGHTLGENIHTFAIKYDIAASLTHGPTVMAPFSISRIGLEQYEKNTSIFKTKLIHKRLRNSLKKLDLIYTRGPKSMEILRDHLGIDEEKISMALDSGFALRFIFDRPFRCGISDEVKHKIVIVPRRDYFSFYKREDLYELCLKAWAGLILWLFQNTDYKIVLSSQNIASDAIHDVIRVLRKRRRVDLRSLEIAIPQTISETCELYGSSDAVITSRMHAGITGLSFGVPAVFVQPFVETKILDIFSLLGLDTKPLLINMFDRNSLKEENFVNKVGSFLENLQHYKRTMEFALTKALPTVSLPVRTIVELHR